MNGITIPMAIMDFIPVCLFFAAALILQRDLYNKMVKGAFALLAAGSIMVLLSGIYKALWKILYAMGVCDYTALDVAFFPIQAPGFMLVFLGLVAMLVRKNRMTVPSGPLPWCPYTKATWYSSWAKPSAAAGSNGASSSWPAG